MLKNLTYIAAASGLLVACDGLSGIGTLGSDFVMAFNQEPNDEPLDPSDLYLEIMPFAEPFNP